MKKVLFLTTYASPYRVEFFDELAKYCDVTVAFSERVEVQKHRDKSWFLNSQGRFRSVQLGKRLFTVRNTSLCLGILDLLKEPFDFIIVCGYSMPTQMLAITWLRAKKIPYYMELDGGVIREDSPLKLRLKRFLVRDAAGYFSTGEATTDYLCYYGARRDRVYTYPFTSLWERDLLPGLVSGEEKQKLREKLGIPEKRMLLSIGQFIPRKGFDVLLRAAQKLDRDIGIYLVGGQASEEYLTMRQELGVDNVHFVGFTPKEQLKEYYMAADLFVLPTREDIWGLVINEAMAYGLPVVTTDRCVAGLELVENGVNGYIVPVGDDDALAGKLKEALSGDLAAMGQASLDRIRPYTYENMVKVHLELFEKLAKEEGSAD